MEFLEGCLSSKSASRQKSLSKSAGKRQMAWRWKYIDSVEKGYFRYTLDISRTQ